MQGNPRVWHGPGRGIPVPHPVAKRWPGTRSSRPKSVISMFSGRKTRKLTHFLTRKWLYSRGLREISENQRSWFCHFRVFPNDPKSGRFSGEVLCRNRKEMPYFHVFFQNCLFWRIFGDFLMFFLMFFGFLCSISRLPRASPAKTTICSSRG